ncbi:lactate utilization protein C [Larkinella harenae]
MDHSSARKNILEKIAQALRNPSDSLNPEIPVRDFFRKEKGTRLERFAAEFAALDGKLELFGSTPILHQKLREIKEQNGWKNLYASKASFPFDLGLQALPWIANTASDSAEAVITGCECLIARTGTIVLSTAQDYGRALTVYAPVHIVVASIDQLVDDIGDGIGELHAKYREGLPSAIFFASGPSRTGDIEKTLVKGVHGPTQVYLFLGSNASLAQLDYSFHL